MTRTVWPEDKVGQIKPEFVAHLIVALCSENPPSAGQLYEAGSGSFTATRWQRARGVDFEHEKGVLEVEEVAKVMFGHRTLEIGVSWLAHLMLTLVLGLLRNM